MKAKEERVIKSILMVFAVVLVLAFTVQQKDKREQQRANATEWQKLEDILGFPPTPSQRLEERLAELLDEAVKAGEKYRSFGDNATGPEKTQAG